MDRSFEARDLIGVMDEAKRYTAFLISLVTDELAGCTRVLDFGAGDGRLAAAMHRNGFDVVAMEPDPELRAAISARGISSVAELPTGRAGGFDGIYSLNVLEHIEDDIGALRSLRESLRPGGRLVLYVPAFQVLFSSNDTRVGHFRRYRMKNLSDLVQQAGMTVTRAEYVDSLGFLAALVYRFFGNRDGDLSIKSVRLYDRMVFPISRVLDRGLSAVLGKNLLITAIRPVGDAPRMASPDQS